jgi:predicted helicase
MKTETAKLQKILTAYLKEIHGIHTERNFREESFYSSLEKLFEECSPFFSPEEGINVRVLPKKTEVGIPDFLIRKNGEIVGHIEAKPPDSNLRDVENSEQIQRYRNALPNVIVTNFLEFRLYRDGKFIKNAEICPFSALESLHPPTPEDINRFSELLSEFYSFSVPEITSASKLAVELAKRAKFLKVVLDEVYDKKEGLGYVSVHHVFQESLIETLTKDRFVDLCAQTITYGLFAAKVIAGDNKITKNNAWEFVPGSLDLFKKVFYVMIGPDAPEAISWIVEDIVKVLNKTDVKAVYKEARTVYKQRDPVIQFYETFLEEYNPEERERLGVYYTPIPVVSYIVRSVHKILKRDLGLKDGFADTHVRVLDPAAGTASFVIRAIEEALSEYRESKLAGLIPFVINDHILPHFYAFELLIVPYVIGHLRMVAYLEDRWNYRYREGERFRFYLTNSLEMKEPEQVPLLTELTEEGKEAKKVKEEVPILVILGNPPYSGISENKGKWITDLIEDYKYVDGKPLGEKNPKWLQDDYVKFIRFGQWKIDRTGEGVLGFITNHSYLDNPTFRGMRQLLMKSFDAIYVLNLHGNSLKREKCPDGSKDGNVFDIRPGVAISLFMKRKEKGERNARVYYAERWGLRGDKYRWLLRNDAETTDWEELTPRSPFYFFVPMKESYWDVYKNYWKITDIMPTYSVGIVTARDKLTIQDSPEKVWETVQDFSALPQATARSKYDLGRDARDWKVSFAQDDLKSSGLKKELIVPILYRPFDRKYTYYTGRSRGFICMPRPEVMPHMMHENLGLLFTRPQSPKYEFSVMVSKMIIDQCVVGNKSAGAGISYIAPLYLYSDKLKGEFSDREASKLECIPNLAEEFLQAMHEALGAEPTPEEIFYYIYAILYSPTYRKRYEEFLKYDFPRVPLPEDYEEFKRLSELGEELVELHLLKHPSLSETGVGFPESGTNKVEIVSYDEEKVKVYFNKNQYFEGISKEVWGYQIGGYQVLAKYLKDRKGRELTKEEIEHYMKVAKAIERTIEVQREIDEVYESVEQVR